MFNRLKYLSDVLTKIIRFVISEKNFQRQGDYVDHLGNLMKPNYITQHFAWVLKKYDMKHIRFHDTRHSCASLLYANGVPMKDIQEWLGHSDISTTMNIYTHLDYRSKVSSANAIIGILPGNKKELLEAAN